MGRPINVVNLHYYFIMSRKESGLDLFQHWQSLIQPEHMIKAGIYDYNCQKKTNCKLRAVDNYGFCY